MSESQIMQEVQRSYQGALALAEAVEVEAVGPDWDDPETAAFFATVDAHLAVACGFAEHANED